MNSFQRAIANLFKIPVPTEKPGRGYSIRKYAGASQSQTSLTDWQSWMTSADNEISSSLRLLISRSRQLYQDDSNVQTAIDELVGTVVGEGINLQSKVKNTKGELNIKVNQEIEDKFNTWAQNREWCDVAGRLTFWQMQAVIQHSVLVDGGILVRVVNKRFGRSPLPFALELIEIDQLDDRLQFWRTANGNEIRMGVEVDQWKRTAAYWILDSHPGDYYRTGLGSLQSRRVPASEILHIFNRQGWRPGQTRGVPQIHAGIIKARHLLGLEESEIVRSRVQSCISAFIENEMPDFEPDVDEYGNAVKDLYPGAIEYLQPGQKLAPFDPSSPNPNLGDFVKHFQRSIAGIFGLSSHTVTRDLSDANYSSLREGKLNEWKSISLYRDQLSEDFNSPVFRRWLDFAVMSGFVKMPKNYESEKESKYYRDYWFGSPMAWVDPAKEMIAKEKEIALGLTTRSRVLAEVGIDFEEILQEKEKEKRLMEQYDVSFGEDDLNPPADGEQPDDGEPAPLVEGMQAVRDTAIAAIRAVTDIQTRTVETVPVQAVPVVERATEPEEEEPVEININMADYLPEPEPTDVGEVYPLLPGMTRAVSVDGERKLKKKKKKNCTNGQVCGFSCISKTKTCIANMTTAQLKEHNKAKRLAAAEKRKAAKGGAGATSDSPFNASEDIVTARLARLKDDRANFEANKAREDIAFLEMYDRNELAQKNKTLFPQYLNESDPDRAAEIKQQWDANKEILNRFDDINRDFSAFKKTNEYKQAKKSGNIESAYQSYLNQNAAKGWEQSEAMIRGEVQSNSARIASDESNAKKLSATEKRKLTAYAKKAQALLDSDDTQVFIAVSSDNIASVLSSGVQNSFENNTRGRAYDKSRMKTEADALGINDSIPPVSYSRPVYGYVESRSAASTKGGGHGMTDGYGEVKIELKPEAKEKSSITRGDSLSDNIHGAVGYRSGALTPWTENKNKKPPQKVSDLTDGLDYIEAQVYGGVSASQIRALHYPPNTTIPPNVVKLAKEQGISIVIGGKE